MSVKKDCFAYQRSSAGSANKGVCVALKKLDCEGCAFYKTREALRKEVERCNKRNVLKGIGR